MIDDLVTSELIRFRGVTERERSRALTDVIKQAFELLTPGEEIAVRAEFGFAQNEQLEDVTPSGDALLIGVLKLRLYARTVLSIFV